MLIRNKFESGYVFDHSVDKKYEFSAELFFSSICKCEQLFNWY